MDNPSPQEVKKKVRTFAAASFFNDLGSDMVFPVWPLYVTSVLGANMTVLGLLDGVGNAIVSISQAISGYISDRIGQRKVFVWIGYLLGGLARIGYALSPAWPYLLPFRLLDRSGKMRDAPRDAIVSEITPGQHRGRSFGLIGTMDNLGAVTGIAISIIFLGMLGYRNLFLLAAIPSVIAALLIGLRIREAKNSQTKIFKGINFKDFTPNLKLYTALSALFSLGAFSYSFLLIFAKDYGFQIGFVPVLYLLFTVVAAVFTLPFGRLSDKWGRKKILYLSFLFWAVVSIIFILSHSYWAIILAFLCYGLHRAALDPVQKALVTELAPKEVLGSTIGGFQMVMGLCSLPASLVAGLLWDRIGVTAPFYLSLLLTVGAAFLLIFVKETVKHDTSGAKLQ